MPDARFSTFRLVAHGLGLERGGRRLIENLDLALTSGQGLVVTGPNGAGKSTLLRALAGLLPPTSGRLKLLRLQGDASQDEDLAPQTHYVGHLDAQKATLTAYENLEFWKNMLSLPDGPPGLSPHEALTRLAVPHVADLPVGYLSAGQKRRVGLARLLVAPRPLWLLDEPTTALDRASQSLFAECMRAHLASGGLLVAATHAPLGIEALQLELGPLQPGMEA